MSFDKPGSSSVAFARIAIIKSLLSGYDHSQPFQAYLKSCFSRNKKFGSRDRKIYASWCYAYFRLGNAVSQESIDVKLAIAWYLVHGSGDEIFDALNNNRLNLQASSVEERIKHIQAVFPEFSVNDLFPFTEPLSGDLVHRDYAISMLVQPRVFARARKDVAAFFEEELHEKQISFERDDKFPYLFSFNAATKLDALISGEKNYFEIQDRSSQIAGASVPVKPNEHWWDCCCGSGGKSLELLDLHPQLKITATDSRASILKNFRERTSDYANRISTTVLDLEQPVSKGFFGSRFDGILADVPCTGSGTWSRTPEQLTGFNEQTVTAYVKRQQGIINSALPFLKSNGTLVYITCSVFRKENEDMMHWIDSLPGISLLEHKFINGIPYRADSMFYSIFRKD